MQGLLERRDALFGAGAHLFYQTPIHIVRGQGAHLFDAAGRRYLDLYNNVPCVGHCHPRVVAAVAEQLGTLNVHSRYVHAGVMDYAERLTELFHEGLQSVVFACSGTEANEVAMRMARQVTGGRGFLCTNAAYHGSSAALGRLTHVREPRHAEIRAIPFPERYRPLREGVAEPALTALYLAALDAAIDDLAAADIPLAGMLVCPLLANEGLPDIPAGFMAAAARRVRAAGGLFICDEVQAGFCRSGRWWGHETAAVQPDIVTLGKPMGAGVPLAGVVASHEHVSAFRKATRYFNTFAASPMQAAAGTAVLDVIEAEGLCQHVAELGRHLLAELKLRRDRCEAIGDVRGGGLFAAVEWVADRTAKTPDRPGALRVVEKLKDKGFLTGAAGAFGNVVKIRPPLVIQRADVDAFLAAFDDTLREVDAGA